MKVMELFNFGRTVATYLEEHSDDGTADKKPVIRDSIKTLDITETLDIDNENLLTPDIANGKPVKTLDISEEKRK